MLVGLLIGSSAGSAGCSDVSARRRSSSSARLLAAMAAYWLGDRALLGMLGARPFALAESPLLRSTTDRLAAAARRRPAEAVPDRRRLPAGVRRRARPARLVTLAVSHRPAARACAPEELRGGDRARARPRARARRAHPDATRCCCRRRSWRRAGSAAGSPARSSSCWRRSAPRSRTCCCRRSASSPPTPRRPAPRDPHDLADALLRLDRAGELVEFAASPATEPLYTVDPFDALGPAGADVPHAPAARSERVAAAFARALRRRGERRNEAASRRPVGKLIRRRPTLPGACAPSTIGAGGLNFSVRNGKRYSPAAMTAELSKVGALAVAAVRHAHLQNSIATSYVF